MNQEDVFWLMIAAVIAAAMGWTFGRKERDYTGAHAFTLFFFLSKLLAWNNLQGRPLSWLDAVPVAIAYFAAGLAKQGDKPQNEE